MSRSRIIFFAIIGLALLVVLATTVIAPQLKSINTQNSIAATTQYVHDNVTTIRVVYGTEKELWFKDAIQRFQAANPDIKIDPFGQGSMEAYSALSQITDKATTVSGNAPIPTLWSPAASIQVNLLNDNNQVGRKLAINCQRLVLSPLVIMTWNDRADAFNTFYKDKGGITFANLYDALDPTGKVNGKWSNLGGKSTWGLLKLGHTNPQDSNSGVMMLVAMANNYYQRTGVVSVGDITDDKFQNWLKIIETGVTTPLISSSGLFVNDVIVKGPASYDFIVGYEALAIQNFKNAVGRQGQGLTITYPPYNLYSDHPMCVIDHPSITANQRAAAKRFQDFLLTPDIQKLALTYGFRPADPAIPVFGANTPFDDPDLKKAGLSADIGQEIQIPAGSTVSQLLTVWRRNFPPQ